jgi:DNA-binding Lrp family transcriptional regulator
MKPSDLRLAVLRLLQRNARVSETEISERLAVPVAQVTRAIAEMERDRTIMGYYALTRDDTVAGGRVRAVIEVEVQPERDGGFDRIARLISKFPEVQSVSLLSGSYDLGLEVVGDSLQEVASFVASKLAPMQGVRSTRTHFLLRKYKEGGILLHEEEEDDRLKVAP